MSLEGSIISSLSKRTWLFLLGLVLVCSSISHAAGGVDVRLSASENIEVKPPQIVTASFHVSNLTGAAAEMTEELALPEGWQAILPAGTPFELKAHDSTLRIVVFQVPVKAAEGRYTITYTAKSRKDPDMSGTASFSVSVQPVRQVVCTVENRPDFFIAGGTYEMTMRLINRGNAQATVNLRIKSTPPWPVTFVPHTLSLEPGMSEIVRFTVKTDASIERQVIHFIEIRAELEKTEPPVFAETTSSVTVLPRVSGKIDPYHRVPLSLKLVGLSDAKGQERAGQKAAQWELSGTGSLDEQKKRQVGILLRSPDIQRFSSFGDRDEFWAGYADPVHEYYAGDRTYTLSPLTEGYRYGRGAEMDLHRGKWDMGAFYRKDRWGIQDESEGGLYARYLLNEQCFIQGNLLSGSRKPYSTGGNPFYYAYAPPAAVPLPGTLNPYTIYGNPFYYAYTLPFPVPLSSSWDKKSLYSIQAGVTPNKDLALDLEYGICNSNSGGGASDTAYRIKMNSKISRDILCSIEKIYAGPRYFGYYSDVDSTYAAVNFPIYKRLQGNIFYRNYRDNLSLDPTRGQATRECSFGAGTSCSFRSGLTLSLDYEDYSRDDVQWPVDYDFRTRKLRMGVAQNFGKCGVQAFFDRGDYQNRLFNREERLDRMSLYSYFNPVKGIMTSFYAINGDDNFYGYPQKSTTFGVSLVMSLVKRITLMVNSDYVRTQNANERKQLFSSLTYTLPNEHKLNLWTRFIESTRMHYETITFLTYQIPFSVPVGKKKSIGTVKGKVIDLDKKDAPCADVLLTAGGLTAVTTRNGEFIFPALKPGTYYLSVEKRSIGLGRVVREKMPLQVEVKGGEERDIAIGIIASCRVTGKIVLYSSPDKKREESTGIVIPGEKEGPAAASSLVESGGLSGILVEISDEKETIRQMSGSQGTFTFPDLRPGKWTLKIYRDDLPLYHHLEKDIFEIDCASGDEKEVVVKVLPTERTIKFIDKGELKEERKNK